MAMIQPGELHHGYLQGTDNSLTLIASGSREWVQRSVADWLLKHEPHSEASVVIAHVQDSIDVGDFVIRELRSTL